MTYKSTVENMAENNQKEELLTLIRTSAGVPEIVAWTMARSWSSVGEGDPRVTEIEKRFCAIAEGFMDKDEIQYALDNGYFDETDGESYNIYSSSMTSRASMYWFARGIKETMI